MQGEASTRLDIADDFRVELGRRVWLRLAAWDS